NNQLYATAYNGTLYKIDIQKKHIYPQYSNEDYVFRNILIDHINNQWLHSSDGILVLKQSDTLTINEHFGLPTNDINTVFEDSENNVWIGTNGKGLLRFTNEIFTYYNQKSGFPSDLI